MSQSINQFSSLFHFKKGAKVQNFGLPHVPKARYFNNPTRNERSECRVGYTMCDAWLRVENTLLLLFLEYTLPEGIKLLFHGNGDNQFFDGSDEIDDPIDSDKAHVYVILKPILE